MKDTAGAFETFYDDLIVIRGERRDGRELAQTVRACVFVEQDADPVDDLSIASEVRVLSASFRDADWRFYGERIQRGDLVEFCDVRYRIDTVSHDTINGWTLRAREVPQ